MKMISPRNARMMQMGQKHESMMNPRMMQMGQKHESFEASYLEAVGGDAEVVVEDREEDNGDDELEDDGDGTET